MKGYVPTPDGLAGRMVERLFRDNQPQSSDRILYPGCGTAPFAAAVERTCVDNGWDLPTGVGIESNPEHLDAARDRDLEHLDVHHRDFLANGDLGLEPFDYVVGNPPYVPIERLSEEEKQRYRANFDTAEGRFDLYILFFERGLGLLNEGGTLSYVTSEKFEYVQTAAPLRRLLTSDDLLVEEIEHIDEGAFSGKVTFPCITTVRRVKGPSGIQETTITLRDGSTHQTSFPADGVSWAPYIRNSSMDSVEGKATLDDLTERISPGLATGADELFVMERHKIPGGIDQQWIRPTVSGKGLGKHDGPYTNNVFLCPYREDGTLAGEDELGEFINWAQDHRERLLDRSCVRGGAKWYSWHETPPMEDVLQPKIVFRDIAKEPNFWPDPKGTVVPRHSVYYAVPKEGVPVEELLNYLNSPEAGKWLHDNCQRAHNRYIRLQSKVLEDLPVPKDLVDAYQSRL